MAHYSRRTYISHPTELEPGDLIDISVTALPYWSVVDHVGVCDDDEYAEDCDGDCRGVIFHVDEGETTAYHVPAGEHLFARFLAETDQAAIDAQNEAHTEAAAARAAQLEVVGEPA
jgi:hypothetical protein